MCPIAYMPNVEDIPEYGAAHPGPKSLERISGKEGVGQTYRERQEPQSRRPHSSDQRRTSRGRRPRRFSELAMQRSRSERTPQRIGELLDESDSGSDTEESPEIPKVGRGRAKSALVQSTSSSLLSRSGSSSGSASTITETTFSRVDVEDEDEDEDDEDEEDEDDFEPSEQPRLDALRFLQEGSPAVTEESIKRAMAEAEGAWSPRSTSSSASSSGSSSGPSDSTDVTSPDRSINGDSRSVSSKRTSSPVDIRPQEVKLETKAHRYGTPEMLRGSAKHPHLPPNELTPRVANPGRGHAKHLPRAEKLPLTGYELLASKLSNAGGRTRRRSGSSSSMSPTDKTTLKPIYRRFETLNHRLLLHLQDELSELEEQLRRLDTTDTQTRRLQNCILPASRRHESMTGGELQWHKTDILGKIGYKLGQYNHVLSSFTETQALPSASMADIEDYRTYLATENPIAEIETRFLDPADDLVCLAPASRTSSPEPNRSYSPFSDDALTPMPRKMTFGSSAGIASRPSTRASVRRGDSSPTQSSEEDSSEGGQEMAATASNPMFSLPAVAGMAVFISMLLFPLVTDFSGRIAVFLVTSITLAALKRNLEVV